MSHDNTVDTLPENKVVFNVNWVASSPTQVNVRLIGRSIIVLIATGEVRTTPCIVSRCVLNGARSLESFY